MFEKIVYVCRGKNPHLLCHFWLVLNTSKLINHNHYLYSMLFVGDMFELGVENGRFYSLNVPLRDGIDDQGRLG